ncbi:hypothetical protein ACP4J4_19245 (plasmid) [Aureimonas ureilytica]|uniref:hypothetical protein n=1 Tax=Aureimonas ureilytica TaxID=401562 RepID=UPI003CF8F81F
MRRAGASSRIARTILVVALLFVVAWLNAATLIDAYGSGAPHYGRTTNMDKWVDPLPWLLPLDLVAIAGALASAFRSRRTLE